MLPHVPVTRIRPTCLSLRSQPGSAQCHPAADLLHGDFIPRPRRWGGQGSSSLDGNGCHAGLALRLYSVSHGHVWGSTCALCCGQKDPGSRHEGGPRMTPWPLGGEERGPAVLLAGSQRPPHTTPHKGPFGFWPLQTHVSGSFLKEEVGFFLPIP